MTGCEQGENKGTEDNPDSYSLSVEPANISAAANGGSYNFAVACKSAWSVAVAAGATWCTVSPTAGTGNGIVTVNVAANQAAEPRTATITFTSGTLTRTTTVTQAAAANQPGDALLVEPASIAATADAGYYYFAIVSKSIWTATVSAGATWCTVTPSAGTGDATGLISVTKNTIIESRAATVTFTSGTLSRTLAVAQAAGEPTLSVNSTGIYAQKTSGSHTIAVTSNTTWTATVNTQAAGWCTLANAAATGNGTVTVGVAANPTVETRAATVTFSAGTLTRTVNVTQAAGDPTLAVNPENISATSAADSYPIAVTSNTSWSVSKNAAATWCSLSNTSATGNGTVTVNVTANSLFEPRAATVTLSAGAVIRKVIVTQNIATPPYAASTRIWTFGTQIWSDAIRIPTCDKTTFENSYTVPQCRSYTSGSNTWYYYNWPFVNANKSTLCPSPWRVPTHTDADHLAAITNGANYPHEWASGVRCFAGFEGFPASYDDYGYYWTATSSNTQKAYALVYNRSIASQPESKYYGMQVRCVKE
jgi:uncharacterized protein (TIGR02145 family)